MDIKSELESLFRARCTVVWLITKEEGRAETTVIESAARAGLNTTIWDCYDGVQDLSGNVTDANVRDPRAALATIKNSEDPAVWILRDFHDWIEPVSKRGLRNLARYLQNAKTTRIVVILTPESEVPPELKGHTVVVDYPIPDRAEITTVLDSFLASRTPEEAENALQNGDRERVIDAALGLSVEEAANCYSRSWVTMKKLDVGLVASEKKRVIAEEGLLEWYDPDPRGLDAVGGYDLLKDELRLRRRAMGQKARAFGLPAPKGLLLVGVAGCGKSLTAKAVASAWGIPLLRFDPNALKSKFVGESETNLRKALKLAATVSPCVLWLDEIEKAMAGATGESGDSGVSQDALGTILTWLQESQEPVFLVATANEVRQLPDALLRKGRFDAVMFVDLPNPTERRAILETTIRQIGRDPETVGSLDVLVDRTETFSGAEIASTVMDGLGDAFEEDERELTAEDIERAAAKVVPLSRTKAESITDLRTWAKTNARPTSTQEETTTGGGFRRLNA